MTTGADTIADDPTPLEAASLMPRDLEEASPGSQPTRVSRAAHARPRAKPGSALAAKAATEYVYVAQDLRRIAVVGVVLFALLFLIWGARIALG